MFIRRDCPKEGITILFTFCTLSHPPHPAPIRWPTIDTPLASLALAAGVTHAPLTLGARDDAGAIVTCTPSIATQFFVAVAVRYAANATVAGSTWHAASTLLPDAHVACAGADFVLTGLRADAALPFRLALFYGVRAVAEAALECSPGPLTAARTTAALPARALAGSSTAGTVTARDAYGNAVTCTPAEAATFAVSGDCTDGVTGGVVCDGDVFALRFMVATGPQLCRIVVTCTDASGQTAAVANASIIVKESLLACMVACLPSCLLLVN